jgi:hypothetical protein
MHYSAGIAAGISAFGAAFAFPHYGPFWLLARLLLDTAGALFGLYVVVALILVAAGKAMRHVRPYRPPPRRVRL